MKYCDEMYEIRTSERFGMAKINWKTFIIKWDEEKTRKKQLASQSILHLLTLREKF